VEKWGRNLSSPSFEPDAFAICASHEANRTLAIAVAAPALRSSRSLRRPMDASLCRHFS
jgi:hypothetical protein